MRQLTLLASSVALIAWTLIMAGCNQSQPQSDADSSTPATVSTETEGEHSGHMEGMEMEEEGHDEHEGHEEHGAVTGAMKKMEEGLAQLSAEDRASAEKQHVCPVSGQMLGTMGAPVKVEVEGRQVWLCCPGCEKDLREKPAEYLAKLPK